MATTRWEPFRDLAALQDRVNRIFEDVITRPRRGAEQEDLAAGQWSPLVDIFETSESIVIRLEVPPLRERPEDIPLLVAHYWEHKSRELGRVAQLSAEALRVLEGYTWPGNIRELVNVVERLLVGSVKPVVEPSDLPSTVQAEGAGRLRRFPLFHLGTVVAEAERRTIERALRQAQGNRNKAAQLVGLSRASFYRKLKTYSLLQGGREMFTLRSP